MAAEPLPCILCDEMDWDIAARSPESTIPLLGLANIFYDFQTIRDRYCYAILKDLTYLHSHTCVISNYPS